MTRKHTFGLPAQLVYDTSGKRFLTETYRRATCSHTLLGKTMCSVAFIHSFDKDFNKTICNKTIFDKLTCLEQPRKLKATKHTETIVGIRIVVVADLHDE